MPMGIIIVAVVIAMVVVAIVAAKQAAERRKRLAAWARRRGLSFDPTEHPGFKDRHPHFEKLRAGEKSRYAHNVMCGSRGGRGVVCFDYHYQTTSTNSKGHTTTHTYRFSAVIIETALPLPGLSIEAEGIFDRLGAFFGFEDIDFESAAFSRRFKVTSDDRRWAYDAIHPATMEFMLARPTYTLRIAAGNLMLTNDDTWKTGEFDAALAYAEGFLDLIPAGVLAELRGVGT